MYARNLTARTLTALADTPVVVLEGARQVGKTTLVRTLVAPDRYLTLDDPAVLGAAAADPAGFVAGLPEQVVVDEVQRIPGLLLAIKASIDRDRRPGRFLLTGSARALAVPELAGALVGRMEVLTLWPFSQGELRGLEEDFVDTCFADELPRATGSGASDAVALARAGGFPEAVARKDPRRRDDWFRSYLATLLQREVRELAAIEGLSTLPNLLTFVATGTGQPHNASALAGAVGLPVTTTKRYLSLLESVFLVTRVPAWSANVRQRLVHAPKLYVVDAGLLAHLLGGRRLDESRGPLLETFVVAELLKQAAWSETRPSFFHFRTHAGAEVDLVLEAPDGRIVGIEIKATAGPTARDVRGLRALAEIAGPRFHRGIVLYTGDQVVPFAERIHAVPIDALWSPRGG